MLMECFGGNLINILNFKQETNKETEKPEANSQYQISSFRFRFVL